VYTEGELLGKKLGYHFVGEPDEHEFEEITLVSPSDVLNEGWPSSRPSSIPALATSESRPPSPPSTTIAPPQAAPAQTPVASSSPFPAEKPDEVILGEWNGMTNLRTRPFHSQGAWELQWSVSAGYFSAWLHSLPSDGKQGDLLANQTDASSSSSFQPNGGDFFIEFEAESQWAARAVALPSSAIPSTSPPEPRSPLQGPKGAALGQPAPRGEGGERLLVSAIEEARRAYAAGRNDMAKGAARPLRAKSICASFSSPRVEGWVGTIDELSTNGDGNGILTIKIADGLTLGTWNNILSDFADHTLIDPASPVFKVASNLKPGDRVTFSGQFVKSDVDCFKESSLTLGGSIDEPHFIFRFSDLQAR